MRYAFQFTTPLNFLVSPTHAAINLGTIDTFPKTWWTPSYKYILPNIPEDKFEASIFCRPANFTVRNPTRAFFQNLPTL